MRSHTSIYEQCLRNNWPLSCATDACQWSILYECVGTCWLFFRCNYFSYYEWHLKLSIPQVVRHRGVQCIGIVRLSSAKSILIRFITSSCVIFEKVGKVRFLPLWNRLAAWCIGHLFPTKCASSYINKKRRNSFVNNCKTFGLGQYKWTFLLLSFQPFGATLEFRFRSGMKY